MRYDEHREHQRMLRAALATAGAHEAPAGGTAQAVLHQELAALVVRPPGHGGLHLGGVPAGNHGRRRGGGRMGHPAAATTLPAPASGAAASHRGRKAGDRQEAGVPPRTGCRLQRGISAEHGDQCEQEE